MKVIGLTGGIGAGKSTAAAIIREEGLPVIDADAASREITSFGSPALADIAAAFGSEYVKEGNLDRKALAALVFADPDALARLEAIITDKVAAGIEATIKKLREEGKTPLIFIDAPLLFECGLDAITDENWLVTAAKEVRLQRVAARDGLAAEEIEGRIRSQMPEEEKARRSQVVFDNSGAVENLREAILNQLERIRNEAQQE